MAQLVEQLIRNEQVVGSSPTIGFSFMARVLATFKVSDFVQYYSCLVTIVLYQGF